MNKTEIEEAKQILKKYNQEDVINIMNNIEDSKKEVLAKSVIETDFEYIIDIFNLSKEKNEIKLDNIEPMNAIIKEDISESEKSNYYNLGKEIIKNNEYAVVTVAGGQGTRLGHNGPKGTFVIDTINGEKSLFEILCQTMKDANKKFESELFWYIMTSDENDQDTKDFFEKNNYFSYNKEKIKFFRQAKLPIMSEKGKVLVDENFQIKEASDGHGGIFNSMRRNNVIEEMKENNIKWVFTCAVDNVLVNMVDPYLLGLAVEKGCSLATRSLVKNSPSEKVGVICKHDNKVKVIEYTELPEELSNLKNEEGNLLFGESHVMFNLFSLDAIRKISETKLPYHVAHKKNSFLDENGILVNPDTPNSYKFESFIFDSFEMFDDMAILRGNRETEFAPIKNSEGNDSPETATKMYNDMWSGKYSF